MTLNYECRDGFQRPLNIRVYNLSLGPHITRFSAIVAKKRKNFE